MAHEVELTVWIEGAAASRLTGALLWTHFGVSGPVALNASRHWARAHLEGKTVAITASFWPGRHFAAVDRLLTDLARDRAKASMHTALSALIPASVAAAVLRRLAIDGESILAHLSRDNRRRLAHALVEWPLRVAGTRGYNYAEVTAGGLALTEIDPATMESRVCPGLYLAGEILDVDGRLGGFNFQWAWATAHVAARGLAAAFREAVRELGRGFLRLRRALPRRLGRRRLVGRLKHDQAGRKHTPPMLIEVDYRVVLVDFHERARPVGGLHNTIAFGPRFHRSPILTLLLTRSLAAAAPSTPSPEGTRRSDGARPELAEESTAERRQGRPRRDEIPIAAPASHSMKGVTSAARDVRRRRRRRRDCRRSRRRRRQSRLRAWAALH